MALVLVLQELLRLKPGTAPARVVEVVHAEGDDAAGILVGEGGDRNVLNHAEHGGGVADAEGQGENRQQGEPRGRPQAAEAVAEVLPQKKHDLLDGGWARNVQEVWPGKAQTVRRLTLGACGVCQFSDGFSAWSITSTSAGTLRDSSLRPSCSCKASKIEGPEPASGVAVEGGVACMASDVHFSWKSNSPGSAVRSATGRCSTSDSFSASCAMLQPAASMSPQPELVRDSASGAEGLAFIPLFPSTSA